MKIRTKLTAVISAAAMLSITAGAVPAFAASADTQAFIDSSNRSLLSSAFDPISYAEDFKNCAKDSRGFNHGRNWRSAVSPARG